MKIEITLLKLKEAGVNGYPLVIEISHKGNRKTTAYAKLQK